MLLAQIIILSVAAIMSQWVAWRLRLPAIIFLLGLGFLLGPITGIMKPEILFGEALHPFVSAAVAIILFEGSLQLNLRELRAARRRVRQIIIVGAPLGWAAISAGAYYIAGLSWPVAVTLGGMLIVTGPTVVMPMLRHARLKENVGSTLTWESIVNDAVGVMFAVLAFEYFSSHTFGSGSTSFIIEHGLIILGIIGISFACAYMITYLFEHGLVPEYLKAPFLLTFVLVLFYLCNTLLYESGLIAVTVLGVTLTNVYEHSIEELKRFKETITLLLVSGVFLLLTADLDLHAMLAMDWRALVFVVALLLIIRPLVVAVCSIGTKATWKEILFMGWIAPRGVVLAVLAGVLGPQLVGAGFEDGNKVLPIAITVVIVSVIVGSVLIDRLAAKFGLAHEAGRGLVIAGAHPWSLQLTELLHSKHIPVLLVDNSYVALKPARLSDVPSYYGDILSDEAEHEIQFHQYHAVLNATYSQAYNAFATDTLGRELGRERVFRVGLERAEKSSRTKFSKALAGNRWGSSDLTIEKLEQLFEAGWRFKTRKLSFHEGSTDSLDIPQENDARMILGVLAKGESVELYSADHVSRKITLRSEDSLIIFEKRDELAEAKKIQGKKADSEARAEEVTEAKKDKTKA